MTCFQILAILKNETELQSSFGCYDDSNLPLVIFTTNESINIPMFFILFLF